MAVDNLFSSVVGMIVAMLFFLVLMIAFAGGMMFLMYNVLIKPMIEKSRRETKRLLKDAIREAFEEMYGNR